MNLRDEAKTWGLTSEEFDLICKHLNREPGRVELAIFAVMWSEHCSYKTTRVHLSKLPTQSDRLVLGPGENAGMVSLDDTFAVAFKIESHNHPSFVEPYQGAATGVGGILRDIFTMGARPIALLNSLHFGDVKAPRMAYLVHGVVSGIADYGNCVGIPTVGGECHFGEGYNRNILVNAMAVGVVRKDRIFKGNASHEGEIVVYLGSPTGSDGIHGATMASEEFSEDSEHKRPTVQVGDPFMEKIVMEACLEIMNENLVSGIQDMGAAGVACSTFEMAERGNSGMKIDLEKVPLRQPNLGPYELFLSESQERMLMVAPKQNVKRILEIAKKWKIPAAEMGTVTKTGRIEAFWKGEKVVDLPVVPVTSGAPKYQRPFVKRTVSQKTIRESDLPTLEFSQIFKKWLTHPQLASRSWIYKKFDHTVGTNTVLTPGHDAALLRIKESHKLVATSVDSRAQLCNADPYLGTMHVVFECARNLACVGAMPLGLTNCLNYGNPEDASVMGDIVSGIEAMRDACQALEIPVTGGNVSLYNAGEGISIPPTPTIAMVGDRSEGYFAQSQFKQAGDVIYLVGRENTDEIHQSEFAKSILGLDNLACPPLDIQKELKLHKLLRVLSGTSWVHSIHDISEGGLLQSLVECLREDLSEVHIGAVIDLPKELSPVATFFDEYASSAVISIAPSQERDFEELVTGAGLSLYKIGKTVEGHFEVKGKVDVALTEVFEAKQEFFKKV